MDFNLSCNSRKTETPVDSDIVLFAIFESFNEDILQFVIDCDQASAAYRTLADLYAGPNTAQLSNYSQGLKCLWRKITVYDEVYEKQYEKSSKRSKRTSLVWLTLDHSELADFALSIQAVPSFQISFWESAEVVILNKSF